ncbi:hypothetical protein AB751O23_AN_00210 [Chlamydiales bacterium SCGC AB-751-O23]|jgi:hypothetical protein|nr:hypothetical protein AB751O23_AN_00210 [Chlamydiales bacterium SCGC AB-751-O23]
MHKNKYWLFFLSCFVGVSLYYGAQTSIALFDYFRFNQKTIGKVEEVVILKDGYNSYSIDVSYSFMFKGKKIEKQERLNEVFFNPWSTELKKKNLLNSTLIVFLSKASSKDETLSKLSVYFPTKLCVYSLALLFTTIYLFFLGRRINSSQEN